MADTKVSAMTAAAALDGTELFHGVQGGNDRKVTVAQVKTHTSASPTLVTPTLGVATATSINKVAITAPAASATLTIADGKTLTASNTLTLAGTDSTTMTFPSTSATVARTDAGNTFTGNQTINEAAGGSGLTITGATQTTSQPILNLTQIWNDGGVTFTGMKFNVTKTAAANASMVFDFQVGGNSVVKYTPVPAIGGLAGGGALHLLSVSGASSAYTGIIGDLALAFGANGAWIAIAQNYSQKKFALASDTLFGWHDQTNITGSLDAIIRRAAAATFQFGDANSATPVAQTVQAQGSRGGTDTDVGGANLTFQSGQGTGAGTVSTLTFKTPSVGASSSTAQTMTSRLVLTEGSATVTGSLVSGSAMSTTMTVGFFNIPGAAGAVTGVPANTTGFPMYYDSTNNKIYVYNGAWKSTAALT